MYDLWLSTLYNLGSRKQNALIEYFESAEKIYHATVQMLQKITWLTDHNVQTITSSREEKNIKKMMSYMDKNGIHYYAYHHTQFPVSLTHIPDPPIGIFVMGVLPEIEHAVALIGSRRCSEYGLHSARMLAKPLAKRGVVIVSGMARGIDSMAHKGALEGSGKTIAVLGCGVDICYPSENQALRNEIIKNGCLVSEYPPGTKPMPHHFPARNRIISGLSSIIVVVEATKKSGSLITVDQAHDQGKEIMVVPGNITSKMSEGTNNLIREGAAPVISYEDILYQLGISLTEPDVQQLSLPDSNALAPEEKVVYDSLTFDPVSFDELAAMTGLKPNAIQYLSTMLEIKGYIKKLPGSRYIRNIQ